MFHDETDLELGGNMFRTFNYNSLARLISSTKQEYGISLPHTRYPVLLTRAYQAQLGLQ